MTPPRTFMSLILEDHFKLFGSAIGTDTQRRKRNFNLQGIERRENLHVVQVPGLQGLQMLRVR